jgi:hypothetical protein
VASTASTTTSCGGMLSSRMCGDRRAHGGGVGWRHGDIDGRHGKVKASIHVLKIGRRKIVAVTSRVCANVRA